MVEPFQETVGTLRKKDMQLFGITAFCLCHYRLASDYSCSSRAYSRISSYSSISNPNDFTTNDINNCLTYTITVVTPNEAYTYTWNSTDVGFDGKILPISEYGIDLNTFTQTFYNNGQVKGSRILKAATNQSNLFEYFGESYDVNGSIPAINGVSISRTVTE